MSADYDRRLRDLEAQAERMRVYGMASRIADRSGIHVDELLAEAEIVQERIDTYGRDAVYAELAGDAGITVAELEASAAQWIEDDDATA
jgi:hypothetical protein